MSGFFLKNGCCHGGLSIAEAAVTGAHLTMLEDFKALLFEARAEQASQPAIVHASAREDDVSNAGGFSCADGRCDEAHGDAHMKIGGDACWRGRPSKIVHEGAAPSVSRAGTVTRPACARAVMRG